MFINRYLLSCVWLFSVFLFLIFSCEEKENVFPHLNEEEVFDNIYLQEHIAYLMRKVCDWQIENPVEINYGNGMAWARSALYVGIMAAHNTTQDKRYLGYAMAWAQAKQWKLDDRYDHPDDHASGQTYLDIYLLEKNFSLIAPTKATFDKLISENFKGREIYWWCDALFMSPPVAALLYEATGDTKYIDFVNDSWWDTHEYLYDKEDSLFFRDKWYFNKKTPNGHKTFWARGNGWVMAGTVRVMKSMPKNNPHYYKYVNLHQEMAKSIAKLQMEDGLWRPSLLDSLESPYPETSSSGFFTYALAWGVNNGYLDREEYLPVIRKAWEGLVKAIHPDGKLGWVQPGGAKPDEVSYEDYQEYGVGAFLLAGSEIYKLNLYE